VLQAHALAAGKPDLWHALPARARPEGLKDIDATRLGRWVSTGQGSRSLSWRDGLDRRTLTLCATVLTARQGHLRSPIYLDFSRDGTSSKTDGAEAFGTRSSIVAQGNKAYNLAQYVNPELSSAFPKSGCWSRWLVWRQGSFGPEVIGNAQGASTSSIVQAVQYAVQHGPRS